MAIYITYNFLWLWIILAGVIGAAAAVLICKLTGGKGGKSIDDAKPSDKKSIIIGLRDNASDFAELYEPTYALACGRANKKEEVLGAWNDTVANGQYAKDFKDAFAKKFSTAKLKNKDKKYVKLADELVKFIFEAGIVRSDATEITADDKTAEKYDTAGTVSIEAEQTYEVLAPYWYMEDQIFVKGVLR